MHAGLKGIISIFVCAVQVIERVFSSADIQRVAIGQKRFSAEIFYVVANGFRIIWAQICEIARFAEMNFDGGEFPVEIDRFKSGLLHQPFQLFQQTFTRFCAHVRKVNFSVSHSSLRILNSVLDDINYSKKRAWLQYKIIALFVRESL